MKPYRTVWVAGASLARFSALTSRNGHKKQEKIVTVSNHFGLRALRLPALVPWASISVKKTWKMLKPYRTVWVAGASLTRFSALTSRNGHKKQEKIVTVSNHFGLRALRLPALVPWASISVKKTWKMLKPYRTVWVAGASLTRFSALGFDFRQKNLENVEAVSNRLGCRRFAYPL